MKLKELKLFNFRKHRMSNIKFDKTINFVFGPNGAGKSSILEAIYYLIHGRTHNTSKSGSGSNDLITFGEGHALIEGDIEKVGKISRGIPHTLTLDGEKGKLRELQNKIIERIGVNEDKIECCIYSSMFTELSPQEKKNFLFELMGLKITDANIRDQFIKWAKENGKRNPEKTYDEHIQGSCTFSTQKDIDDTYESLVDRRKILKREVTFLENTTTQENDNKVDIKMEDTTRKKLDELKKKETELTENKLKSEYKMNDIKSKLSLPISDGKSKEDLLKEKDEYVKLMSDLIEQKANKNAQLAVLSKLLNNIINWDNKCPVFIDMECTGFNESELEGIHEKKNKEYEKTSNEFNKLAERIKKGHELIDKINKDLYSTSRGITSKEHKELEQQYKKIEKEIKECDYLGMLEKIRKEIDKYQEQLTNILAEKQRIANQGEKVKNLKSAKDELKNIEVLADGFGPNGLKSIVLRKVLDPFTKQANNRMMALSRNKISLDIRIEDDDVNIYMIEDNLEKKYKFLSSSEKLRVRFILSDVISQQTKLGFLIIDDIDRLDKENTKSFINLLKGIKDEYDTIIALATGEAFNMDEDINVINL